MTRTLVLDGRAVRDIPSFYDEINRVFMAGESWRLGASLDALDDLLRGGYGATRGAGTVTLVWRAMEDARAALGREATAAWLRDKLGRPGVFDAARIRRQLDALEDGTGPTYFDTVLGILADHPRIRLVPA